MNRAGKTILWAGLAMTLALVFLILSTSSKNRNKQAQPHAGILQMRKSF
jgi:hypothetical protein